MKFIAIPIILLSIPICFSQQLPTIKIDSSRLLNNYQSEISDYVSHLDDFIIYENRSSWTKTHQKYLIGREGKEWVSYIFTVNYKGERDFEQSKFKIKKRKNHIKQDLLDSVLTQLDNSNFYILNIDSLNLAEIVINDSLTELLVSTDGNIEVFTISTHSGTYTIYAHNPGWYQRSLYMEDRRVFIESRKLILSLF